MAKSCAVKFRAAMTAMVIASPMASAAVVLAVGASPSGQASFATPAILVLWLHLMGRVVLLTGAWIANPPRLQAVASPQEVHAHERPNYVTLSVPATLRWPHQGLTGSVGVDRAVLAPQGGATEEGQRAR